MTSVNMKKQFIWTGIVHILLVLLPVVIIGPTVLHFEEVERSCVDCVHMYHYLLYCWSYRRQSNNWFRNIWAMYKLHCKNILCACICLSLATSLCCFFTINSLICFHSLWNKKDPFLFTSVSFSRISTHNFDF